MTSHPVRISWTLEGCRAAAAPAVCPDLIPPVVWLPKDLLRDACDISRSADKHVALAPQVVEIPQNRIQNA